VNIAYEMSADKLSVLSSSRPTIDTFLSEATAIGLRVPHVLEYRPHEADLPSKVESFLRKLPGKRPVVVLIAEAGEAVAIAEHLKHVQVSIFTNSPFRPSSFGPQFYHRTMYKI
jgi:hypothetical protein